MNAPLKTFKKNIRHYNFICCLVLITATSFILQPTNIRIFGASITGAIMMASTFFFILNWRKYLPPLAIFIIMGLASLLIINNSFMHKNILLLLMYIIYVIGISNCNLNNINCIKNTWKILGYVCLILAFIGFYRYIFGYINNPQSENKLGIFSDTRTYHYMGISYYPSTRNSDAIYFGVGFIIFSFFVRGKIGFYKYINYFFSLFLGFVCIITFSRGLWISILLTFLVVYFKDIIKKVKKSNFYKIFLIFVLTLLATSVSVSDVIKKNLVDNFNNNKIPYDPYNTPPFIFSEKLSSLFNQLISSIISIFNPDFAKEKLGNLSSNYDRINLLLNGWDVFINNIFGINSIYINGQYKLPPIHYENIYIDLLVIFGIFFIPIIFFLFLKLKYIFKFKNNFSKFLFSIFLFIIIYHLFNSGINFIFLWFILSLILLSINNVRHSMGLLNK